MNAFIAHDAEVKDIWKARIMIERESVWGIICKRVCYRIRRKYFPKQTPYTAFRRFNAYVTLLVFYVLWHILQADNKDGDVRDVCVDIYINCIWSCDGGATRRKREV